MDFLLRFLLSVDVFLKELAGDKVNDHGQEPAGQPEKEDFHAKSNI